MHHKAYKFRIYPNKGQITLINKTFGCVRMVFNYYLDKWNRTYEETGEGLSFTACCSDLTKLKQEDNKQWLKEEDAKSLLISVKQLSDAFLRYYRKQSKKPNFKTKKNHKQSYSTSVERRFQSPENTINGRSILIRKLGWVRFANSRSIKGRIIKATITRESTGKYFISLLCEEDIKKKPKTNQSVGLDLGINDFAVLSDGRKCNNKRFANASAAKLKREKRKMSRRALNAKRNNKSLLDSKNYQKQRVKVSILQASIANQRNDFLHKFSTEIVKNHDKICIEDLNINGMLKNKNLARSISDVSWGKFIRLLEYKAEWYGKEIIKVDRWFPSTQICSSCNSNSGRKPLHIRKWQCEVCGSEHDRDINAAKNILIEGIKTAGTAGLA